MNDKQNIKIESEVLCFTTIKSEIFKAMAEIDFMDDSSPFELLDYDYIAYVKYLIESEGKEWVIFKKSNGIYKGNLDYSFESEKDPQRHRDAQVCARNLGSIKDKLRKASQYDGVDYSKCSFNYATNPESDISPMVEDLITEKELWQGEYDLQDAYRKHLRYFINELPQIFIIE